MPIFITPRSWEDVREVVIPTTAGTVDHGIFRVGNNALLETLAYDNPRGARVRRFLAWKMHDHLFAAYCTPQCKYALGMYNNVLTDNIHAKVYLLDDNKTIVLSSQNAGPSSCVEFAMLFRDRAEYTTLERQINLIRKRAKGTTKP